MLHVCIEPGCPELTESKRCTEHHEAYQQAKWKRDRERWPDSRPSASARGYGARWRKTRANFLRFHTTCEDESGCIEPATDVDHIDGLGPNGPMGHDFSNLRALCHSHHSKRTARDQQGGWNAR